MGTNKQLRDRLRSLERKIAQHRKKIELERIASSPDLGLIGHWRHEIETWKRDRQKLRRRLRREW